MRGHSLQSNLATEVNVAKRGCELYGGKKIVEMRLNDRNFSNINYGGKWFAESSDYGGKRYVEFHGCEFYGGKMFVEMRHKVRNYHNAFDTYNDDSIEEAIDGKGSKRDGIDGGKKIVEFNTKPRRPRGRTG